MAESTPQVEKTSIDATPSARAGIKAIANRTGLLAYRVPDALVSGWHLLTDEQKGAAIAQAPRPVDEGLPAETDSQ